MKNKKLKKPKINLDIKIIQLYGYPEGGGSNDAPMCDPNDGASNCRC